jgi:hypothetical protein
MSDPPRLRSVPGSLEAQLLDAVREVPPSHEAQEQVWQRLGLAAGAGALGLASTSSLAAQAAAGAAAAAPKALGTSSGLLAAKWALLLGVAAPAAGLGVHWVLAARAPSASRSTAPVHAHVPPLDPAPNAPRVQLAPLDPAPSLDSPAPAPRRAAPSALDAESALLKRARERLEHGQPKAALDDVSLLASRFPHGELAQERDLVAIKALLALGQRDAAASRAADFLRLHPVSPYADSVRLYAKP